MKPVHEKPCRIGGGQSKLSREKLYALATAKAQIVAAKALLSDAVAMLRVALGEKHRLGDVTRNAVCIVDTVETDVSKRLEGER